MEYFIWFWVICCGIDLVWIYHQVKEDGELTLSTAALCVIAVLLGPVFLIWLIKEEGSNITLWKRKER